MAEKYLTKSGLVTVKNEIDAKYQAKEKGKGLSSNDYTTNEKTKLAGIASGAEVNVIQGITVNGEAQNPAAGTRAVNLTIPEKTSDLTNDSNYQTASEVESAITGKGYQTASEVESAITGKGYQTASEVESAITGKGYQTASEVESAITGKGYQTASEVESAITGKGYQTASEVQSTVNAAIASVNGVDFAIVDTLPTNGKAGTFYLVGNGGTSGNSYDEYVYITKKDGSKAFEKIGTTDVDLSGYLKTADVTAITNDEIDAIFNS